MSEKTEEQGTSKFKPRSWAADPRDLETEYNAWEADTLRDTGPTPEENYSENIKYVKQGKLNQATGRFELSPKARTILRFNPSPRFKARYDAIRWDS